MTHKKSNFESCSVSHRRIYFLILIAVLYAASLSFKYKEQQDNSEIEAQVKVAYVYNFTKLLQWPQSNPQYFYITVLGKSQIADQLYKLASKEKIGGKTLVVNEIFSIDEISNCNILYISSSERKRLNEIIKKIKGRKILLVSSIEDCAENGVGIGLLRIGDKIRFEVNRKALEEEGIIPNSSLLSLAYKIYN
jgi:hypothetical protein